jgi:hypothetical protein
MLQQQAQVSSADGRIRYLRADNVERTNVGDRAVTAIGSALMFTRN